MLLSSNKTVNYKLRPNSSKKKEKAKYISAQFDGKIYIGDYCSGNTNTVETDAASEGGSNKKRAKAKMGYSYWGEFRLGSLDIETLHYIRNKNDAVYDKSIEIDR